MADSQKTKHSDAIRALFKEVVGDGKTCPKCGGAMAHYRFYGYRCLKGARCVSCDGRPHAR